MLAPQAVNLRLAVPTCLQPVAHQQSGRALLGSPSSGQPLCLPDVLYMARLQDVWQLLFSAWLATWGSLSLASN